MRDAWGIGAWLCIFVGLAAGGCTKSAPSAEIAPETVSVLPGTKPNNLNWVAESLSLTCILPEGCATQVGVLLFASLSANGKSVDLRRCTASLLEPGDKIVTSGHCDFSEGREGYFITRTDIPQKAWRKVKLHYKEHTPDPEGKGFMTKRPDFAIFTLSSPITEIKGYKLPRGKPREYKRLIAHVVKPGDGKSPLNLHVGKIECQIHRNELYFPYDLAEKPNIITAYKCGGEYGNSGAPMLADGVLEAVFSGARDMKELFAGIREHHKREPYAHERHLSIEATNLRCVGYPEGNGQDCVEATNEETARRFDEAEAELRAYLRERQLPSAVQFETGFRNYVNQAKVDIVTGTISFEVMYYPACRRTEIRRGLIPMEWIDMTFDEWAKRSLVLRQTYVSEAQIINRGGDTFVMNVNWVPSPVPYANPEKDPRARGHSFSVALPPCAR